MTQIAYEGLDLVDSGAVDSKPSRLSAVARRVERPVQALRAVPHVGTWVGVLLTCAGAVLLTVAWVRVAALTNVGLQLPYVVSAGFGGLGLVVVGLTAVSINAKREDAAERTRQLGELSELLAELRKAVGGDQDIDDPQDHDAELGGDLTQAIVRDDKAVRS